MTKRATSLAWVAIATSAALAASTAQAKYVVVFQEVGSNVVETGSGSLDLAGLPIPGGKDIADQPLLAPNFGLFVSGAMGAIINTFGGDLSGPQVFGAGPLVEASSSSGDGVGVDRTGQEVFVPKGYMSGAPLSETSTYVDQTLFSLDLFAGTYVYSWGSGGHADTFTIKIASGLVAGSVPEPSTWAMMLIGFAGLGYAGLGRKRSVPAFSA